MGNAFQMRCDKKRLLYNHSPSHRSVASSNKGNSYNDVMLVIFRESVPQKISVPVFCQTDQALDWSAYLQVPLKSRRA